MVFAVVLGMLFFGEMPDAEAFGRMALIVGSTYWLTGKGEKSED